MADEKSARERITEGLDQAGGGVPEKTNSATAGIPAGGGGKVVRDAAGNVIGNADRAQVVRDKFGHIIGEVGPPEPEPGPSARELIEQGFAQQVIDAEKAMVPIIDQMTAHVKAVRALRDRTSQWSFRDRQETRAKETELRAKYEAAKKELAEARKVAGMYNQHTPFLKDVDTFLGNLERHLKDEDPKTFHLNRF